MKQSVLAICIVLFIVLGMLVFATPSREAPQNLYLRIHIRANSNTASDQSVKYKVKNEVVGFLTPLLVGGTSLQKARQIVQDNLGNLNELSKSVLQANGFDYRAQAKVTKEVFPTRVYNQFLLEEGYYDALVIELGDGLGDNWWCVVYPPLCFVGEGQGQIEYKSKLAEIIEGFKNKYFT